MADQPVELTPEHRLAAERFQGRVDVPLDLEANACRVSSSGALLAVQSVGAGDPVVFLHAAICDSRMWARQLEAVGDRRLAVAYDRRGFGETVAPWEEHSAVSDLAAVLHAIAAGQPAVLVGCSQGGGIAINAALMQPSLVRALVLVAPNVAGAPEPVHPPETQAELERQKQAENAGDIRQVTEIKARLWLDGPSASPGRVGGDSRQLLLEMNAKALRSPQPGPSVDAVAAYERLSEIQVPTLVVWGDLDFPHIQERCRHVVESVNGSRGHEISGAAHLPNLERPAEVTKLIVDFLDRLDRA